MNEDTKKKFEPVKDEMYQLLLTAYCYNQKFTQLPDRAPSKSRGFLLEELISLRHLANGIILHLCNLDDENSKWSLRGLYKDLARSKDGQQHSAEKATKLLKEFRANLNRFKTKHRNAFIAHRNSEDHPNPFDLPDYRIELKELIGEAVLVFEALWGSEVSFGFDLGSLDPSLEFKKELGL